MTYAKRELAVVDKNGRHSVTVTVFAPEPGERGWACRYEIEWPGRPRSGAGYGIDGMQALTIALQIIGTELYTSDYHKAGTLVFDRPGNGYGFPVPKPLRDALVGEDAIFDGNI
jgi:hypothetical protein